MICEIKLLKKYLALQKNKPEIHYIYYTTLFHYVLVQTLTQHHRAQ